MGEDGGPVRSGQAPQVLAALRNVVVHLWSQETRHTELGVSGSGGSQYLAARPHEPLKILGFSQLE
ncbi:MAG TPA: hypothetical protein VFA18_17860 [Gemmataceae bacterium]|nr:hypothetical protein [Gemmataceae bacterium]